MRAGRLARHSFQLQRRVSTTDAEGATSEAWTSIGTVRGSKRTLTAQEQLVAAQAGVIATHEIQAWRRPEFALSTAHNLRLVEGSAVLELAAEPIDPDDAGKEVRLQVRELIET